MKAEKTLRINRKTVSKNKFSTSNIIYLQKRNEIENKRRKYLLCTIYKHLKHMPSGDKTN